MNKNAIYIWMLQKQKNSFSEMEKAAKYQILADSTIEFHNFSFYKRSLRLKNMSADIIKINFLF